MAIPIRTIRSWLISMRSPQRRKRAPRPMWRERQGIMIGRRLPTTRAVRRPTDECAVITMSVDEIGRPDIRLSEYPAFGQYERSAKRGNAQTSRGPWRGAKDAKDPR